MSHLPICFIDTETTSLRPDREIWEIGIIRREPGDPIDEEHHWFLPVDLSGADPMSLDIGRFYERHPLGRYVSGRDHLDDDEETLSGFHEVTSMAQAAEEIAAFTHRAHVVGAVPNFDTEKLDELVRNRGHLPNWHYHLIDVENLAVGFLRALMYRGRIDLTRAKATPEFDPQTIRMMEAELAAFQEATEPPWNSTRLGEVMNVRPQLLTEVHTALGDARWARRMYDTVMGNPTGYDEPLADDSDVPDGLLNPERDDVAIDDEGVDLDQNAG